MKKLPLALLLVALLLPDVARARDAAFVEPGTATSGKSSTSNEALVADPKTFDAGESTVGVSRRVTLFFVNAGSAPVTIADLTVTGDGNVTTQREDSDCHAENKIAGFSRCTVALTITPTSAGFWSVEILARHDGMGRIARAQVKGKAVVDAKSATRGEGLNLSSRDMKPVDFGDVDTGGAPAVRTALLVNDSPEPLTIKAIDLIMVDEHLERLLTGCDTGMELKSDESCPIAIKWQPRSKGNIATDLIIRHTGKIGFTVIPIRGRATGDKNILTSYASGSVPASGAAQKPIIPPSPEELEQVTGKLPAVTDDAQTPVAKPKSGGARLYLIGAVGTRAILQRNGVTRIVAVGQEAELGGADVQVLALTAREARVLVDGQHRSLKLGASDYRPSSSGNKSSAAKAPEAAPSSNSQSSSGK